jgi:hypothetical protein
MRLRFVESSGLLHDLGEAFQTFSKLYVYEAMYVSSNLTRLDDSEVGKHDVRVV